MKRSTNWAARAAAWSLVVAAIAAQAAPVTVATPFFNLEYRGVNSVGWTPGSLVRFGANSVTPDVTNSNPIDWNAGTVAWALKSIDGTTTCEPAGTAVCRRLFRDPSPLNPHFVDRYLPDDPLYRGTWTLNFQNGTDLVTRTVYLDPAATQAPKVANITISGNSLTPTFSWAPPPGSMVDGYRVNIYDKGLMVPGNSGQVFSKNLTADQTSFTIDPAGFTVPGYGFAEGANYMIEISLIQKKDRNSASLGNSNVQAIARTYADFTPVQANGPIVNLPVIQADGSFLFDLAVVPGQTYFIDPEVAIGYDYAIGAGNPNFASVDLPDNIGDGIYDIFGFDTAGNLVLLADDWDGRNVFTFGAGGVDRFRVLGIEINAGLDPLNTTAFITGLTFTGAGQFTGTQTPITVTINDVPAPPTLALLVAALGAAGWQRRRRPG